MITLDVDDYCQECAEFDPCTTKRYSYADNEVIGCSTWVFCSHRELCQNLKKYFTKEN